MAAIALSSPPAVLTDNLGDVTAGSDVVGGGTLLATDFSTGSSSSVLSSATLLLQMDTSGAPSLDLYSDNSGICLQAPNERNCEMIEIIERPLILARRAGSVRYLSRRELLVRGAGLLAFAGVVGARRARQRGLRPILRLLKRRKAPIGWSSSSTVRICWWIRATTRFNRVFHWSLLLPFRLLSMARLRPSLAQLWISGIATPWASIQMRPLTIREAATVPWLLRGRVSAGLSGFPDTLTDHIY